MKRRFLVHVPAEYEPARVSVGDPSHHAPWLRLLPRPDETRGHGEDDKRQAYSWRNLPFKERLEDGTSNLSQG